jgi:hypothetical protein
MSLKAGVFLAVGLVSSIIAPLRATTITSTSYSDWASSTTGGTHDADFTQIHYNPYGSSGYTTSDGFAITGPDSSGFFLQGVNYGGYQSLEGGNDAAATVLVTAPGSGSTALLFLLGSSPSSSGYTVTLSDGQVFTLAGSTTFFGVSVSHPITSAILQATAGSALVLSDVSYANTNLPLDSGGTGPPSDPGDAPEARTCLLLGSGLLVIASLRRRLFTL